MNEKERFYNEENLGKDEIPVVMKTISSVKVNSQEFFKRQSNVELILSFIYSPLKYKPSIIVRADAHGSVLVERTAGELRSG